MNFIGATFFSFPLILDVTNYTSFDAFVHQIDDIVKEEGLNVLINNAAVSPEAIDLNTITDANIRDTFETNTIAPIMLTKVCLFQLLNTSIRFTSIIMSSEFQIKISFIFHRLLFRY